MQGNTAAVPHVRVRADAEPINYTGVFALLPPVLAPVLESSWGFVFPFSGKKKNRNIILYLERWCMALVRLEVCISFKGVWRRAEMQGLP